MIAYIDFPTGIHHCCKSSQRLRDSPIPTPYNKSSFFPKPKTKSWRFFIFFQGTSSCQTSVFKLWRRILISSFRHCNPTPWRRGRGKETEMDPPWSHLRLWPHNQSQKCRCSWILWTNYSEHWNKQLSTHSLACYAISFGPDQPCRCWRVWWIFAEIQLFLSR